MIPIDEYPQRVLARARESFSDFKIPSAETLVNNYTRSRWSTFFRNRLVEPLAPLIKSVPDAQWLTVGDGWGFEAYCLKQHGADVLATDLNTDVLSALKDVGLIERFESQNIEKLSYPSQSFDFVVVKEMLHHLACPYIAIYEMLRVARKAVIIIEPQDPKINENIHMLSEGSAEEYQAHFFGNKDFFFERIGNYIYRLSAREIEKVAAGLGRVKVAFRGLNDLSPCGRTGDIDRDEKAFAEALQELQWKDHLSTSGFRRFELLMAMVFVTDDLPSTIDDSLRSHGWEVKNLPKNPYL